MESGLIGRQIVDDICRKMILSQMLIGMILSQVDAGRICFTRLVLRELKIDGKQPAERASGLATNQNQSEALK